MHRFNRGTVSIIALSLVTACAEGPDAAAACGLIPGANDVSWMTSIPASILSLMILRGQIEKAGVYPCETLDREQREIVFNGIREWEITVQKQVTEIA